MPYKIFTIPIPPSGGEDEDLNGDATVPYQVFTVEFIAGKEPQTGLTTPPSSEATARVDYREKLAPDQFALYCRLRDLRRAIAEEESVKPFVVFTNAQLAAFAQTRPTTLAALREVEGVGEARAEKYGIRVLAVLAAAGDSTEPASETKQIGAGDSRSEAVEEADP